MGTGPPGSWRQAIRDAANGEADQIDGVTRRMFVAIANKGDSMERKLDKIITLLISTTISIALLAAGVIGNLFF